MAGKKSTEKSEKSEEQFNQAVAQALSQYFTPEINERIRSLPDDEMWNLLRDLETQPHWFAILRYVNQRLLVAQQVVNNLDPITQATSLCRTQGIMTGLTDIQNVVVSLVEAERSARQAKTDIESALG